jgi:hypothetical protein
MFIESKFVYRSWNKSSLDLEIINFQNKHTKRVGATIKKNFQIRVSCPYYTYKKKKKEGSMVSH